MSKVFLSRCQEYDHDSMKKIIAAGMAGAGFDPRGFRGKRVALKPNLLMPARPEKAIVTHPAFVGAVAEIVRENGGSPVIIESPAMTALESTMKKSGYSEMVAKQGIEVADVSEAKVLYHGGSQRYRRFEVSKALFDVDIIINLPKLKTHGITYITGAVKNLFGTIPGLDKSKWHMKAPTPSDFSEFLLDLNEALLHGFEKRKRILHVMDAIVTQEKDGPGPSGTPKKIGAIIIGESPVAVDFVAVRVAGLDYEKVPTVTGGFRRDLGAGSPEEIEVLGTPIDEVRVDDFIPTGHSFLTSFGARWPANTGFFKNMFTEKPVPVEGECTLCYQCKNICPAGAIGDSAGNNKVPVYDYRKCIRCYCCREICPQAVITLKRGRLQFILG
ncbi:MAG TPA: DUF362 domain-containing protein [Spirochaetota bacterium]|nr:DUF362 domain-containing protein [Spirochaetota bacterium]